VRPVFGAFSASNAFTILPNLCRFPQVKKMGLNDLTLEKLISEINGYKEKMRAIHEDYGRASQDLQDRINVLGYNLNEHLKETKDQMGSTPQRLLNLETKYVTGEVNEAEYRNQREEFKALLDRNLHSIEEIKSMISVLQQIEVKPLAPAEFKQSSTSTPRVTGEDWGRGAFSQDKPFTIPQSTAQQVTTPQTGLRVTSEQLGPGKTAPVESSMPKSSPSPPQPQSNGGNWSNPQSSNAAPVAPPAPTVVTLTSTGIPITAAPAIPVEPALAASSLDTSDAMADDSVVTVPTVDIVETGGADDALMVKVVDDFPSVEASSALVSGDTASLQSPAIAGTETATVVPAAPDLAQVSLTSPSQFYNVVCPKCGADVPKPAKVWELKGGKSKKNVLIGLFQCQDCRVKFREALTREII